MSDKKRATSKPKLGGVGGTGGAPRAAPKAATRMSGWPSTVKAIDCFLKAHSGFESSVAHNAVLKDINECGTLNEAFLVPLRHKMINMESSLKFVLFLRLVTSKPIDDAEPEFPPAAKFSTESALDALVQLYDLAVQDSVWAHVDDALGGDEGDDEDAGDTADDDGKKS
jgi:hypothetical protein